MSDPHAHHVGITVEDLDRAVDFYTEHLGLELLSRFAVDGPAFATGVGVEDARADFAHLDAGDVRLELVTYRPEGAAVERAINQPGASHVGFSVDDLDAFYEALDDDVETQSSPQLTDSGTKILFLSDPEGNLVEVLELEA